ncbi:UNVERIFIED_CONTAM: hypothetical protein FKN15_060410 [Acipenser sinensis]
MANQWIPPPRSMWEITATTIPTRRLHTVIQQGGAEKHRHPRPAAQNQGNTTD